MGSAAPYGSARCHRGYGGTWASRPRRVAAATLVARTRAPRPTRSPGRDHLHRSADSSGDRPEIRRASRVVRRARACRAAHERADPACASPSLSWIHHEQVSLLTLSAVLLGSTIAGQSPLTTTFASNNGGSNGGAVYFDLTPSVDVSIVSFNLNFGEPAGTPAGVTVYIRPGTSVGFESDIAGWARIATDDGNASCAGPDIPTAVRLNRPVCLTAGTTWGVALVAASTVGHQYTNGTGSNQTYSTNELQFDGGAASNAPFAGSPFTPRIANCSIFYATRPGCSLPPTILGVGESTPNTGTLSPTNGTFEENGFVRYNFDDITGNLAGQPVVTFLNVGRGGSAPTGMTPFLPGFEQVWLGSMPVGPAVDIVSSIGGQDQLLPVPAGFFAAGDTVRLQGIVLAPGIRPIPALATGNSIEFTLNPTCLLTEDFEGLAAGANYPAGWADGGGQGQWEVDSGGTTSGGTGPNSAVSGSNYLYCETSSPRAAGDLFILNSAAYTAANEPASAVSFQLSRVGATIGTLEVRLDDGSGTYNTVLATYTGPEPNGAEWTLEVVQLPQPLPANYSIQFRYARGTSFTGDLAIDDFCLAQ